MKPYYDWWEAMQIVFWGGLGWGFCVGAVSMAWLIIAAIAYAREDARFKALFKARRDEKDCYKTNGRDHGKN